VYFLSLQAVQQDEARPQTEAARRPLPVRNLLQDDVALALFSSSFYKSSFGTARTDGSFISTFWCLVIFPFSLKANVLKGPYFSDLPPCSVVSVGPAAAGTLFI